MGFSQDNDAGSHHGSKFHNLTDCVLCTTRSRFDHDTRFLPLKTPNTMILEYC